MRKALLILAISLFAFTTAVNAKNTEYPTSSQTEISQSSGWESLGIIKIRWFYWNGNGYRWNDSDAELFVRVIGGNAFYKVRWQGNDYTVTNNPDYGKTDAPSKNFRYKAGERYLNL